MQNIKCKCGHDGFIMDKDGLFYCTKCGGSLPINLSTLMKGEQEDD